MKNFNRENLLFSLCGLNCGLCPMNLNNYCPGCGGGEGNQSCAIARCSIQHGSVRYGNMQHGNMQHGNIQYCFECENYPCEKYSGIDEYDSFITHQHRKRDMEKFETLGSTLYTAEQQRKVAILLHLLQNYNDGRKKTLFCIAVNLLELADLEDVIDKLDKNASGLSLKDKSAHAANLLQELAAEKSIRLKLHKKKKGEL